MDEPTYQEMTPEQMKSLRDFPHSYCYKEGKFLETFQSPYLQYAHRIGCKFTVLRELTDVERDPEVGPMWKIQFEDGSVIDAWPEEICVASPPKEST